MEHLKRWSQAYLDSFSGLNRAVWILTLVTFVDRAATMVVAFMSLHLAKDMSVIG